MKSIVALVTQRMLILAIVTVVAIPSVAKQANWRLDGDHSTARILLGANAFNIGVARVSGNVELNPAEPANSMLDLSINPAGDKLITFNSRRATVNRNGKLEISGDLTLSRVVHEIVLNSAEDYYGPVYGAPVTETTTREVTFVLPMSGWEDQAEITAEANISGERFPELFAMVADTNWRPVIQDKACEMPLAGDDYAGALCPGTVVEADRGEDYPDAPQGNLVTIVLKLRLTREILSKR